jgi:nicotinamidase/pyrazinamidase
MATAPQPGRGDALLIVEAANDVLFASGGLPGRGDAGTSRHDGWIAIFVQSDLPVIPSRDWHLPRLCIFAARDGCWSPHCKSDETGADYSPTGAFLDHGRERFRDRVENAGGCSCFAGSSLHARLQARGVTRIFIGGPAAESCVIEAVREALSLDYAVVVVADCVRDLDALPGEAARQLAAMRSSGMLLLEG